jgi:hypothetical protein
MKERTTPEQLDSHAVNSNEFGKKLPIETDSNKKSLFMSLFL